MTIPLITALPTAPDLNSPTTFNSLATTFVNALEDTFVGEMNASIAAINAVAVQVSGTGTFTNLTSQGTLDVSGVSTLDGNLTVGETSNDNHSITIQTSSTGTGKLAFGNDLDSDVGRIVYDHFSDSMRFWTDAGEKMRLTSTGLGIGTTGPDKTVHIEANTPTVRLAVSSTVFGDIWSDGQGSMFYSADVDDNGIGSAEHVFYTNGGTEVGQFNGFGVKASGIYNGDQAGQLNLGGGENTTNDGANITVYGQGHATLANDIKFRSVTSNVYLWDDSADAHLWYAPAGTEAMRLNGSSNLLIGGTVSGSGAAGALHVFNGSAPTGSVANGVILYSEDVAASAELKVRDEAGNITTLSPHNFSQIPNGASEEMAFSYYSERAGRFINVDMLKVVRLVEKHLADEALVHIGQLSA